MHFAVFSGRLCSQRWYKTKIDRLPIVGKPTKRTCEKLSIPSIQALGWSNKFLRREGDFVNAFMDRNHADRRLGV